MGKKDKICIPEDAPVSELERSYLDELYATRGDKIREQEVNELFLVRFLRGYVNAEDPKKVAFDVIDKYLAWAEEVDVRKIAATPFPKRDEFFGKIWPSGFHGFSKDGHPVYIDRPGQVNPKVLNTLDMEEFTKMHIQSMEWLNDVKLRMAARTGKQIYKHVVIFDMEDFGFSHFGEKFRGPLKSIVNLDSSMYPETLSIMYVVNASFMFKAIWACVSPWLDDVTKSRIQFVKTKELLKHIDADQLPDFLGGTCVYTPEKPCFVGDFKSGPGGSGELDALFHGLLEDRIEKQQRRLEAEAAAEAQVDAAETETQAVQDSTESKSDDAPVADSEATPAAPAEPASDTTPQI